MAEKKNGFIEVQAMYKDGKGEPMTINTSSISYYRKWYPNKDAPKKDAKEGTVIYLQGKDKYIITSNGYEEIKKQLTPAK